MKGNAAPVFPANDAGRVMPGCRGRVPRAAGAAPREVRGSARELRARRTGTAVRARAREGCAPGEGGQ